MRTRERPDVRIVGGVAVLVLIGLLGGVGCKVRRQAARVSGLAEHCTKQEALTAAAIALSAAGSDKESEALIGRIEKKDRALAVLELARYAALDGQKERSVHLVRKAVTLTTAANHDAAVTRLSAIAAGTRSAELLAELNPLLKARDTGARALTRAIIAECDVAVATGNWRLVEEAEQLVARVSDQNARDTATLAIVWAIAKQIAASRDLSSLANGEGLADSIHDAATRVQAFGLLAESCMQSGRSEEGKRLVEQADLALAGRSAGEAADAFGSLALVFRRDTPLARGLLEKGCDYAERSSDSDGALPDLLPENRRMLDEMTRGFAALRLSRICVAAAKAHDDDTTGRAFSRCLRIIRAPAGEPALEMMRLPAIFALARAAVLMDSPSEQKTALSALHNHALSLREPVLRSVAFASVSRAAQQIAVESDSKSFLEIAWQATIAAPVSEFTDGEMTSLAHCSGHLDAPEWVLARLGGRQTISADLEVRLRSAALAGMIERERGMQRPASAFLDETQVDTVVDPEEEYW